MLCHSFRREIKMKKASRFLKQLFSAIVAAVRERSTAVRAKTSAARTRLIVLGILRNKKLLMSAINSKIHVIMGGAQSHAGAGGSRARVDSVSEHGNGHHLVSGGGGSRKAAALLQSLPSFVLEQEKRAVVLLSSLPSFAMGRDGGGSDSPLIGGNGAKEDQELEKEEGGKQLQLAATNAAPGSVIELARGAAEQGGAEFRLEDEIDHVADVFIRRFHDQMKLQKLDSFKRFCEMLQRN